MINFVGDIYDFHEKFGLKYSGPPRELLSDMGMFRIRFMKEELDEYGQACLDGNKAKQLDALVDLVYVAIGTAYLQGFDFTEAWRRVHAANMKKVRAVEASASVRGSVYDVVKPPGWQAPNLEDLV